MWWPEVRGAALSAEPGGRRRRRQGVLLVLVSASGLALGACSDGSGLRPLYATTSAGGAPGVEQKLAHIEYVNIPGRIGQRVRNELIFQSTGDGRGRGLPPVYRVEIALRESMASTLVARSGDASAQIYTLDAQFRLIRIADNKLMLQGSSHARGGFERYTTIYSNVRAREDAENRAATTIAGDIKSRLAAFLSANT
jgi:LPS-assembly lipoprotein